MIRRAILLVALLLVAVVLTLSLLSRFERPRLSEQEMRTALFTTIQRESPQAFLVTGSLDITATTRVENTRVLLPGIVGLDLGTTRATVRVPGRVSYGFQADSLRPDMFHMLDDGSIQVELPALAVYSVEVRLADLEVETVRGWARLGSAGEAVERQALAVVENALRRQGADYIRASYEARINTARALERMLTPPLQGLGMEDPRFRFRIADDLVVEPTG